MTAGLTAGHTALECFLRVYLCSLVSQRAQREVTDHERYQYQYHVMNYDNQVEKEVSCTIQQYNRGYYCGITTSHMY